MKTSTTKESIEDKSSTNNSRFVYVTYIRTTQEKLWEALTKPEFNKLYWGGVWQETDWKVGSKWNLKFPDGRLGDSGEIEEFDKPKRIVITWRNEFRPELKAEGYSRCTFDLEPLDEVIKLTITHEIDRKGSKLIDAVSNGWPKVLASLKSLMETGKAMEIPPCEK